MMQRLKQGLTQRPKTRIIDPSKAPSAVLVPIFYHHGEYCILFTKRTENVQYHKGQVSFPGGAYETKDGALVNTALRESAEEIGLAPEAVEVLGELDDAFTGTSGFIISPFVGAIPWPYPVKVDPIEAREIIEVPVSALLDKDCLRQAKQMSGTQEVTVMAYHYQGHIIWGATARILSQFLEIWGEVAGKPES